MLVRHYIHQRLHQYYAQAAHSVVGGVDTPIAFGTIWSGEWGWKRVYDDWYSRTNNGQWLTPTELFQPYYSQCIAEWIVERIQARETSLSNDLPVDIIEVGGGRGTNAMCILDHLEKQYPALFKERLGTYALVDSSATLLELQKERTSAYKSHVRFRQCDMNAVAEGKEQLVSTQSLSQEEEEQIRPTIALFCEVLDNLPHDRLANRRGQYMQTELVENTTSPASSTTGQSYQEIERPLTDALLQQCLATHPRHSVDGWYPTVAIAVLQHLAVARCDVWAADFDDLSTGTRGDPLVTDMEGRDHVHYLADTTVNACTDILFPTDFALLARTVLGCNTRVEKQADFLRRYPHIVDRTRLAWTSSYNPMVDDFTNCSVLTLEQE